jgi:magnesium chelatase accessory protein
LSTRGETPLRPPPAWWPHRERSRFVGSGALQWHLQCWGPTLDHDTPGHDTPGHTPASTGNQARAATPTALLLHGTGAATHSWRSFAPRLAQRMPVIAVDLPGHGYTHTPRSQALGLPDVAAALARLLSELQLQPTLVVGHSAGAAIALRMVLDAALKPRTVVAINGAILPLQGPAGHTFLPLARALVVNPLAAPMFALGAKLPGATRSLLAGTGSRIDEDGLRCYRHLVTDAVHVAGALRLMASWDLAPLERDLERLAVPLLLLSGAADRTLPPTHAARVQARCAHAQRIEIPGLGHLAHEEDAQSVLDRIEGAGVLPTG